MKCPSCGQHISFFESMNRHLDGSFSCPSCKARISRVKDSSAFINYGIAIIVFATLFINHKHNIYISAGCLLAAVTICIYEYRYAKYRITDNRQMKLSVKALRIGLASLIGIIAIVVSDKALLNQILDRINRPTVASRVNEYREVTSSRMLPLFRAIGMSYPPRQVAFLYLKDEKKLNLYAADSSDQWKLVHSISSQAASGKLGPKLREGDRQVPEGIYQIESFNPNSSYHLSLRLNYPNDFDKRMATFDGRKDLGTDIMIHGEGGSIGCISLANENIEDLFVLASDVGRANLKVIIAPTDLRKNSRPETPNSPVWVSELDNSLRSEFEKLP